MREMTPISLYAVLVLREMLAQLRLVQVVKLLAPLLLLRLHDRNWNELSHLPLRGRLSCLSP